MAAYVEQVKAHTFQGRFVDTELDLTDEVLVRENAVSSYAAAILHKLRNG